MKEERIKGIFFFIGHQGFIKTAFPKEIGYRVKILNIIQYGITDIKLCQFICGTNVLLLFQFISLFTVQIFRLRNNAIRYNLIV